MSFRIQNNIAAINSLRYLNINNTNLNSSLSKLSSGYRINSGADDAAGLAASMRLRAEVNSLKVASRNAAEATSLLQVAEGAMSQMDLILNRMKELATQAASGNTGTDRDKLNNEVTQLETELSRIVNFTKYNGTKLLDGNYGAVELSSTAPTDFTAANGVQLIDVENAAGAASYTISAISHSANTMTLSDGTISQQVSYAAAIGLSQNETAELHFSSLGIRLVLNDAFETNETTFDTNSTFATKALGSASFQIGAENNADNRLAFSLDDLDLAVLAGGSTADVDVSTVAGAQAAIDTLDDAISTLADARGDSGALINRLAYAQSNLAVSVENKTASESVIRDVDMASEMATFTKNQILVQASTAMLAQANTTPQNVLALLR